MEHVSGAGLRPGGLEYLQKLAGDELRGSLVDSFLDRGPERIREIVQGARAGDVERVARVARSLRVSGGHLGCSRLEVMAGRFEALASAGGVSRVVRIRELVPVLVLLMAELTRELRSERALAEPASANAA